MSEAKLPEAVRAKLSAAMSPAVWWDNGPSKDVPRVLDAIEPILAAMWAVVEVARRFSDKKPGGNAYSVGAALSRLDALLGQGEERSKTEVEKT